MTDENGAELMTQTEAARLRGMTLAAVNENVRRGRWRSTVKYGKRLVYRADVVDFDPKTHKLKHPQPKTKSVSKKATTKSGTPTRQRKKLR